MRTGCLHRPDAGARQRLGALRAVGLSRPSRTAAFTLVEILMAIGIFSLVLAGIYSSWTAILRASKIGLQAAATIQRSRIAVRTLEDSLVCIQSFAANQRHYGFIVENGSEPTLSFVARLPKSFPRSGKFGDFDVRRVTFAVEPGPEYSKQLVLRQNPLLTEWDIDEKEHPLVLAKYVKDLKIELWDQRAGDWTDEWKQTNAIPKLVRLTLTLADNARATRKQEQEIVRLVSVPSSTVQPAWQMPMNPGFPGGQPGAPVPPGQGVPGQPGGGMNQPGFIQQPGVRR